MIVGKRTSRAAPRPSKFNQNAPRIAVVVEFEEHAGAVVAGPVGRNHDDLTGPGVGIQGAPSPFEPHGHTLGPPVKWRDGSRVVVPAGHAREGPDPRTAGDGRESVLGAGADAQVPDGAALYKGHHGEKVGGGDDVGDLPSWKLELAQAQRLGRPTGIR